MHRVRAFRFAIAGLLLVVVTLAAIQADLLTAAGAFGGSVIAAIGGVGVKDRAALEIARETGWRQMEPWGPRWFDIALVLMLLFSVVPVVLHALPT